MLVGNFLGCFEEWWDPSVVSSASPCLLIGSFGLSLRQHSRLVYLGLVATTTPLCSERLGFPSSFFCFLLFSSVFFCFLRFSLLQPEELLLQLLWLFSVFFGDHLSPFSCRLDLGTRLDHRTFTLRENSHGFLASRNSSHDFLAHFPFITDRIIDGIFSVDPNGNFHSLLLIHWEEDSFIFSVRTP